MNTIFKIAQKSLVDVRAQRRMVPEDRNTCTDCMKKAAKHKKKLIPEVSFNPLLFDTDISGRLESSTMPHQLSTELTWLLSARDDRDVHIIMAAAPQ